MPEYLAPGVYIEEVAFGSRPIQGVSTSTVGFIGVATAAAAPVLITSFVEYEHTIGNNAGGFLPLAVRGFFENGGTRCYVALIAATDPLQAGLDALAAQNISILCCPDENGIPNAAAIMAADCEHRKDRVCILQSPQPAVPDATHHPPVHSAFAAYYYPWITVVGLDGSNVTMPSGGHVAGIYAKVDTQKGVWKPPAGVPLAGVTGLSQQITAAEADLLASRGINLLRFFVGQGNEVWGARTTSQDPEWIYINVRRLMIYIEQSIHQGVQWAVFEPNSQALWASVRLTVADFLLNVWQSGALQGTKPAEAFFVQLDNATMTQNDIDAGRLVVLVGVAPLKPAEFVLFRITVQTTHPLP